jgi:ppGpp synthetase/RelA/SpoT-type nucleotidyltranferase
MIIPAILIQKYKCYEPIIKETAMRVKETLVHYCEQEGYAFASRIKTCESLAEKIETGRFQNWSDLDDLFACTIVIPNLSQEDKVSQFCRSSFSIKKIIKRGQVKKAPDVFRFDSTRINAQLRKSDGLEIAEQPSIYDIVFEIQIQTAFEHAWSVSTHNIVYKGPDVDWKRQRLAAQIKASVEQLDTLILAFDHTLQHISENEWTETKEKKKIANTMQKLFQNNQIPSECRPKDLSRFCDNLYALLQASEKETKVTSALKIIEDELSKTSYEMFPRSISLLQLFLAILLKNSAINLSNSKYCFHISDELLQIYPVLHAISLKFNYDG